MTSAVPSRARVRRRAPADGRPARRVVGALLSGALLLGADPERPLDPDRDRAAPPPLQAAASSRDEAALTSGSPETDAPVLEPVPAMPETEPETLAGQRERLVARLRGELRLTPAQLERLWTVFRGSAVLGQGNPLLSVHPMTRAECRETLSQRPHRPADAACGLPYMVTLHDPSRQTAADARVCIDQYEFPGIPCEYPVVHVSASEAVQSCAAIGKRLCDAHEWEGACAGALRPPDTEYDFGLTRAAMRAAHNREREILWAYGREKNHRRCGTSSTKTPGCPGSGFGRCGSNTYPTGSFPDCVSPFGVYDLHGNAAEHMSLPLRRTELGSAGGHGWTEMKGSWFIFALREAHPDDCRWRAPDWHGSRVTSARSHANYHLGFRCCRDIGG